MQPGAINIAYLEHLTKTGIDSVRMAHGLTPLRNDSILYLAAQDHAHYLDSLQAVTHFENDRPLKYAPSDRVKFYGGRDFSVGENVLFDYAFTPTRGKHDPANAPPRVNNTYGEMAHAMVMDWVHSPPHYKNMLTPGYEFTGLAVVFDEKTNRFYGVQVFGALPYYKPGTGLCTLFPYEPDRPALISDFHAVSHTPHSEVHAWNLRAPEDSLETCVSCTPFSSALSTVSVINGNIVFTTKDADLIKALIDNRTDGLAAEIVGYKPFDCGNPQYYLKPSRRNGQCIFSGRVLKPVYRKKLKHGFKNKHRHDLRERFQQAAAAGRAAENRRAKRKCWFDEFLFPFDAESYSVSLGKFPKDMESQYYEINVIIIQKNKVCRVLHFTSFCGEDWMPAPIFTELPAVSPDTLVFQNKMRTYFFRIPFEQGKATYTREDIQPFLDTLKFTSFRIVGATINAFASVEGSTLINAGLQEKRAQSIVTVIDSIVADSFPAIIHTAENWSLFDQQVQTVPAFLRFKGKTHEEIKNMLGDTALAHQLEPWLGQERYAAIALELEIFIRPVPSCEWIGGRKNAWSDSLAKTKNRRYLDSLNRIQNYYFALAKAGKADTLCLENLTWPDDPVFDTLAYNHAWLARTFHRKDSVSADKSFYAACVARVNGNPKSPYWPCVFAMVNQYIRYWNGSEMIGNTAPEVILEWLQWLKETAPQPIAEAADSLQLIWHYKAVRYFEAKGKKYRASVNNSLGYIVAFWYTSGMNDSIALKLSNYLLFHDCFDQAFGVLEPLALLPAPDHRVLMQYIRLSYRHVENDTSFHSYASLVRWASEYLAHEEWCSLFVGPCNISFQLFDSEEMRSLYCEECAGWKNYGRDPSKWEDTK